MTRWNYPSEHNNEFIIIIHYFPHVIHLLQRMCCTDNAVHMSQSPDFVLEGDKLTISCTVSYSGLLAPEINWHPFPDVIQRYDTGSSVTSVGQITVPADSVQSYTCYVRFNGSIFPSANQTSTPVKTSGACLLSSLFRASCDYCMPICCGYCCGYKIMCNLWTNTNN